MRRLGDERGETLVELMITVLVISIGFVSIVGAMGASIISADAHSSMASGEVVLRDFTEAVRDHASTVNVACPTAEDLTPDYEPTYGWSAEITGIEWWIVDEGEPFTDGAFGTDADEDGDHDRDDCVVVAERRAGTGIDACLDGEQPECDPGLRRLQLQVWNEREDYAKNITATQVVVRRGNP
jgi:Tfp pilus assembly protein PilE